ncbi:hypothetical protein BJ322DRAFT_294510 [Thelephora terrestris]|uniref:DUF6535 domain-containing protein n=1 Tax=Thelephora terrestris TaxID=56493 RepID=A0A9P6L2Y3_9AGAM|nr:hypothetical protein BJ322DRAFT_294510 [Thelephora terrestris]
MHESWRQGGPPAQEDYRAQFYDKYWKVAEEHDKKFLKKYDLDFNTTLIFAGLLSAVTSAFIIQVNSQLQPNSGVETTALLRSFIHKIDNTMFGNVSTPPQWGGPSWATVLAQIFLVISLAASLFSAFLAVLGKQWLSCYESIDLRETVIERGQNRQQKLDGLVTWRFHRVMESLPLMLQVALFFLGYAVPLSLMDNSTMISFVALGLTSFGVLLHFSVVIAGAVFKNCPYQTSASYLLRHLRPKSPSIVHSLEVSNKLAVTPPNRSITMVEPERVDLQCVSWILWTSPDKTLHLSTLLYLASISTLDGVDPTLVLNCFYIFASCTSLRDQRVAIMQGSEQLAAVSAKCLSRCWEHHVSTTNPRISRVLEDLRRRYTRVFPINTDFGGLPFGAMIVRIHSLSHQVRNIWKSNSEPALQAYTGSPSWPIRYSRQLLEDAQEGYRMTQNKKVPRRILWSALRSLSLDPPDSAFDVAHYLMVIAIDLDLDILTIVALDAR